MDGDKQLPKPFAFGEIYDPNKPKPIIELPVQKQSEQQQDQTDILMKQDLERGPPQELDQKDVEMEEVIFVDDGCNNRPLVKKNGKKIKYKKIILSYKTSSERIRIRKIRRNRQLRKIILPKNALMALHEVKGLNISDFIIENNPSGGFKALVTVNNKQYGGEGTSKIGAKNDACEKALRDYIIAKMRQKPRKSATVTTRMAMHASENASGNIMTLIDANDKDDLPMLNLASFALYKLFLEWEKQGYVVPELHSPINNSETGSKVGTVKEPKKLPIRNELPADWKVLPPAAVLCMMRPGIIYNDLGSIIEDMNPVQRFGVTIDGTDFIAHGRSKKLARRNVAIAVCNKLFGTDYVPDEK